MSPKEFKNLPRYENGRIKNLPEVFYKLTPTQVLNLDSDDWSYYHELMEELNIMYAEEIRYIKKEMEAA